MLPEEEKDHPLLIQLNQKQREAVVCEDKRILILAGAGSGKTKTLIQKVIYLIFEKHVDPRHILAITFTKNAANEMLDRLILTADKNNTYQSIISNKKLSRMEKNQKRRQYIKQYPWLSNITVKTFHGLCNQILRRRGGKEFDTKYKILSDNRYDTEIESKQEIREYPEEIVNKILVKLCEDAEYLLNLKRYILDYYLDELNIKFHKKGITLYEKPFTTLKGDRVASKAERDVADWLYRHRVKYTYEPTIAPGQFEMQPDFFIEEANIFLEVVSSKSYPLKDKEQVMHDAGKNYLKLHDTATHDTTKFNQIMDNIIFSRIDKNYLTISPLDVAEEFRGYEKYLRLYVLDVLRMIDKIKVEHRQFQTVYQQAQQDEHARIREFYKLSKPIWQEYHHYCTNHSYLDFNDLLIHTITLLESHKNICQDYQNRFKYILVDEFQDVNTIQVKLLKLILNTNNQLFCVGDDWQSIYGFRGSNVKYIVNFETFFPNPKLIQLHINYRSNNTIVQASNKVISYNKYKIEKEIQSFNTAGKKIYLYCAEREIEDGVDTVVKNIDNLLKNGFQKEDILVLSRTRKTDAFERYFEELRKKKINITTIHKAKGLEARAVFIIGLTGGHLGFPNVRDTDRIFQIIKQSDYELTYEEERRLFYVALTRAQEELFLISEVGNESEFIKEIPGDFIDRTNFLILDIKKQKPIICRKCKKHIKQEYQYCPYCGLPNKPKPQFQQPQKHETYLTNTTKKIILKCLQEIKTNTGRSLLSAVLKGSKTIVIFKTRTHQNTYYGSLSSYTLSKIISFIDNLRNEGYIESYKSDSPSQLPLIRLSQKGEKFLKQHKEINQIQENINTTDPTENKLDTPYKLGITPKAEHIQSLIQYTKSKIPNERRLAASALGKHKEITPDIYEAVPSLIDLLHDSHPQVREYSIKALGEIGDKRAINPLEHIIYQTDDQEYNQRAAKRSIEKIIRKNVDLTISQSKTRHHDQNKKSGEVFVKKETYMRLQNAFRKRDKKRQFDYREDGG